MIIAQAKSNPLPMVLKNRHSNRHLRPILLSSDQLYLCVRIQNMKKFNRFLDILIQLQKNYCAGYAIQQHSSSTSATNIVCAVG